MVPGHRDQRETHDRPYPGQTGDLPGIAASIQQTEPGCLPLFQGKQWTTRLEIGFAALFAAAIAGVLVLLIAVTLILLKLGFLLLLVVGPFFLLIGTHPGFGRVVALRWFEMLVGVLLKQAAVALVLSVLLYCYALIMGTSDAVLPVGAEDPDDRAGDGRRVHLPQAVPAPVLRRRLRHDRLAGSGPTSTCSGPGRRCASNTTAAAAAAVPGFAAYRAARWPGAIRSRRRAWRPVRPRQAAAARWPVGDAAGLEARTADATLDGAGVAPRTGPRGRPPVSGVPGPRPGRRGRRRDGPLGPAAEPPVPW